MPEFEEYSRDSNPALTIRFPDVETIDVLSLGAFLQGFGEAFDRVAEIISPEYPLRLRAKIFPGSMDIHLFAEKKRSAWDKFKEDNLKELRIAPAKMAAPLAVAATLAAIAWISYRGAPPPDPHPHPTVQIVVQHHIEGPPHLSDIGHAISNDPQFCRAMGKAYRAVWMEPRIKTMEINQANGLPPLVMSRDEIASAVLECRARLRK